MYDKNNVFARILRGEIPSDKVYENEYAYSFRDIEPAASNHVLIIPRGEYTDILDFAKNATPEEQVGFWDAFAKTAKVQVIDGDFNTFANTGNGVYINQAVPHFHMHLIYGEKIKELVDLAK